jgi:protein tyrosine phosphatase
MGKNMSNFDIIWQNLQIQMVNVSNFDEVTKQKYGIYWTNLDQHENSE